MSFIVTAFQIAGVITLCGLVLGGGYAVLVHLRERKRG